MRTETIEIYTFDELPESAQESAIQGYREASWEWGFSSADEWRASLEEFCKRTGIKTTRWEVSVCSYSFVDWEFDPWPFSDGGIVMFMGGLRLRTWLINNWLPLFRTGKYYHRNGKSRHSRCQFTYSDCPLTGWCYDMALIEPILQFVEKPDDRCLADLINDCFGQWVKEYVAEMEYQDSDECIRERIEANEYEFYADGGMV